MVLVLDLLGEDRAHYSLPLRQEFSEYSSQCPVDSKWSSSLADGNKCCSGPCLFAGCCVSTPFRCFKNLTAMSSHMFLSASVEILTGVREGTCTFPGLFGTLSLSGPDLQPLAMLSSLIPNYRFLIQGDPPGLPCLTLLSLLRLGTLRAVSWHVCLTIQCNGAQYLSLLF